MRSLLGVFLCLAFVSACSPENGANPPATQTDPGADKSGPLTVTEMKVAQKKVSALYPFNQLTSEHVNPNILVLGGNGSISTCVDRNCTQTRDPVRVDYTLYEDKETPAPGEMIFKISYGTIDNGTDVSAVVKSCIIAQAKEFDQVRNLIPNVANVYFAITFGDIEVYDHRYRKDPYFYYKSSLRDLDTPMYFGTFFDQETKKMLFEMEDGIHAEIDLKIHLDRPDPCVLISTADIAKKLENYGDGGRSRVR